MRIAVVDTHGVTLMPYTPTKTRYLFKSGAVHPKHNKLGLFFVQLYLDNQSIMVGVDPGSKFEGDSVVGTKDTMLSLIRPIPPLDKSEGSPKPITR